MLNTKIDREGYDGKNLPHQTIAIVTQLNASSWRPPADLKTHAGNPPPADADFFMPPPPTIGELISIGTTLKTSARKPLPLLVRCLLAIVSSSLSFALLLMLNRPILGIIAAIIVGAFVWLATQFQHTCSYIGTDGIVSYVMTDSRSAMPKESFMLFTDAHSLYTKTIRNYTNGIYSGTDYAYTWKKHAGTTHVISGSYHSKKSPPTENDRWHFANMAESVWSSYVLSNLNEQLDLHDYIEFPVAQSALQAVRIGRGFMEFVTKKDGTQRVFGSDMRDISLGSGTFQFKHQDAKWWSGKGKYAFEYANIPNARVFLICLEDLAGITWN